MKIYKMLAALTLGILMFTACDEGEENVDWKAGDSLIIQGNDEVEVGTIEEPYYVEGFTINKDYIWTVEGATVNPVREGQYINVDFSAAGTYTITVTSESYQGELVVTAKEEM